MAKAIAPANIAFIKYWGMRDAAQILPYNGSISLNLDACLTTTSVVAGAATGAFAAFHFQRMAAYGLIANLAAMPVFTFWVMPAGVAALALSPVGLDGPALAVMDAGLRIVLGVAHWTAELEGAVRLFPALDPAGLVAAALGGPVLWSEFTFRPDAIVIGVVLGGERGTAFDARVVDERAAELAVRLADGPREVDVAVVPDVLHLDEHLVARLPVETLQPSVEFRAVEQSGDALRQVDEDAEVGVAVDRAAVEPSGHQLIRAIPREVEHHVLLVTLADAAVDVRAADDTRTHLQWRNTPGLKRLSKVCAQGVRSGSRISRRSHTRAVETSTSEIHTPAVGQKTLYPR